MAVAAEHVLATPPATNLCALKNQEQRAQLITIEGAAQHSRLQDNNSKMVKQLIVTADDYGLAQSVNDAIEGCFQSGVVRAACVMTNMPEYAQVAALKRRFPQHSVGIHWNLTQGWPVLSPSAVPSLVRKDGTFSPSLRGRWLRGQVRVAEIRAELTAQYERYYRAAGVPDFWNTHQNFHVFPGIFQVCVELGRELDIPCMRSHRRFTVPCGRSSLAYHMGHAGFWVKGQVIARWSRAAERRGVLMPAGRIHTPGYAAGAESLVEVLRRIDWSGVRGSALELVIHPATAVDAKLFGGLTESRVREYQTFRDPQLKYLLQGAGVNPVGFDVLDAGEARREKVTSHG
jgi:chitin disaccharide deacetylase